jgi:hypothetical protein
MHSTLQVFYRSTPALHYQYSYSGVYVDIVHGVGCNNPVKVYICIHRTRVAVGVVVVVKPKSPQVMSFCNNNEAEVVEVLHCT